MSSFFKIALTTERFDFRIDGNALSEDLVTTLRLVKSAKLEADRE